MDIIGTYVKLKSLLSEESRGALLLLGAGIALLVEHVVTYGVSWDCIIECHGLYGLIMIILSFIILRRKL